MDTNIKISNLLKRILLVVIVSFLFACSKCEGPVPMASSTTNHSTSSTVKDDNTDSSTMRVVGGDDNEDDDDNRGNGIPKRK